MTATTLGALRRRRLAVNSVRYLLLGVGAVIMVLPLAYMLSTSFKSQTFVLSLPPQFVPHPATLQNYPNAWREGQLASALVNSIVVAVVTTAISLLLSSMMAYGFARFTFPGKEALFKLLLLGLMIPAMMLIIPQFILAKYLHLLDSLAGLVVFYVASTLALNTFLLRGFFEAIPAELEQAMEMDGANAFSRYWRLIIPLARPALATACIFTFLASWDEYSWALTILTDPQKRTLPLAIALFQGQNSTLWGLVFAGSMIALVPMIVVFLVFQRYFVQGLTSGALKG